VGGVGVQICRRIAMAVLSGATRFKVGAVARGPTLRLCFITGIIALSMPEPAGNAFLCHFVSDVLLISLVLEALWSFSKDIAPVPQVMIRGLFLGASGTVFLFVFQTLSPIRVLLLPLCFATLQIQAARLKCETEGTYRTGYHVALLASLLVLIDMSTGWGACIGQAYVHTTAWLNATVSKGFCIVGGQAGLLWPILTIGLSLGYCLITSRPRPSTTITLLTSLLWLASLPTQLILQSPLAVMTLALAAFALLNPRPAAAISHRSTSLAICVLLVSAMSIPTAILLQRPTRSPGGVLLLQDGTFETLVPSYESLAHAKGCSMGWFARLLELGPRPFRLHSGIIRSQDLDACAVLVVCLLNRSLSVEEQHIVTSFVKRGGSLLVLGDHTDIDGHMVHTNRLLQPFGIALRFDSAMPTSATAAWGGGLSYAYHPITLAARIESDPRISVGGSLVVSGAARALIVGRDGYSDHGDHTAAQRAFLGDWAYDRFTEQKGDLILVAETSYGGGKVMVFSDTALFQESSLVHNCRFVMRVVEYLATTRSESLLASKALRFLCLLVMASCAAFCLLTDLRASVLIVTATTVITICVHQANLHYWRAQAPMPSKYALIYSCPPPLLDLGGATGKSLSGLEANLMRIGCFPIVAPDAQHDLVGNAAYVVAVPGSTPLSVAETDLLLNYARRGGRVIVSCGYQERDTIAILLSRLELAIDGTPLGVAPVLANAVSRARVQMVEAWPISGTGVSHSRVLLRAWDFPVAIARKLDRGMIILIADSRFLTNVNIESDNAVNENNVEFLRGLFTLE